MNNVRNSVIDWNIKFPSDRAWRKKYGVPYNSNLHREVSFLDQIFDLEEDKIFHELTNEEPYIPNIGDWLKPQKHDNVSDDISSLREEFKDVPDE